MEFCVKYLILCVISLNLFASEKFVYTFKKLIVGKGSLVYEINKHSNAQEDLYYQIKSNTEIYLMGSLNKQIKHVSNNRKDLTPVASIYCQWPRPQESLNSCSALNFNNDGSYLHKAFDTENIELINLSINDNGVDQMNIQNQFQSFTPYADQLHDLASFFLSPRYHHYTMADNGKAIYLALLGMKAKLIMKVERDEGDSLKLTFTAANGTSDKVKEYIPKYAIYNAKSRIVTQVVLRTKLGDVKVKLDRKQSRINNSML